MNTRTVGLAGYKIYLNINFWNIYNPDSIKYSLCLSCFSFARSISVSGLTSECSLQHSQSVTELVFSCCAFTCLQKHFLSRQADCFTAVHWESLVTSAKSELWPSSYWPEILPAEPLDHLLLFFCSTFKQMEDVCFSIGVNIS